MEEDLNAAWCVHVQKKREESRFTIECSICKEGDREICECSKELFIAREKGVKEYPYECFLCEKGIFKPMRWHYPYPKENREVTVCHLCMTMFNFTYKSFKPIQFETN